MHRFLLPLATMLILGGTLVLGLTGWGMLTPAAPLYLYHPATSGAATDFPEPSVTADKNITIDTFDVRNQDIPMPLARVQVGRGASESVLLGWKNLLDSPFLALETNTSDVVKLAEAVAQHLPKDAVILSWWDSSRQLKLLTEANVVFDAHLGQPLLIPEPWSGKVEQIVAVENGFWDSTVDPQIEASFSRYVAALAENPDPGIDQLRQLAGDKPLYIIVRVSDAYRVGLLHPKRIGVGFKDFPRTSNMHGTITSVKKWLHDQGYDAYTVEQMGPDLIRVFFLTDARSQDSLIARMLPFSSSSPNQLSQLQLVYQLQGYWIYRIPSDMKESASS